MNSNGQDKSYKTTQIHLQRVHHRQKSRLRIDSRQYHLNSLELGRDDLGRAANRLQDKHFMDLYDFAPTGYLTFSSSGLIRELNLKVCAHLALSRTELVGRSFLDFVLEEDKVIFLQHIHSAFLSSQSVTNSLRIVKPDGSVLDLEMVSLRWRDDRAGITVIRSSLHEISGWKVVEKEMKAARDEALAATQAKSQFLAHMSHEMRTPLGVIMGFTDLLREEKSKDEVLQGLDTIHRNSAHLLNLVDDLLDLAKIEAGQMTLELMAVDIREEMALIVEQFQKKARDKSICFELSELTALPQRILVDPNRFRQIILNLLSNALKFTAQGFIRVELSMRKDQLCIDVVDSGHGIHQDQAQHLFQPFKQADISTSRQFGGTGLGLCLSRSLAEAMGGTVELLVSAPNKGSTFRVTINTRVGELSPAEQAAPAVTTMIRELPSLEGTKILVVEDGVDNQVLIKKLLETIGAEVDCAIDGEEAVEFAMGGLYDVILMDIQLPVMDGYEATTHLRLHGCHTPIIALTAHALVEDRMRAEAGGFDDFISKPIDWFKLTHAIVRCRDINPFFH